MLKPRVPTSSWLLISRPVSPGRRYFGSSPSPTATRSRTPGCPTSSARRSPGVAYAIAQWRREHSDTEIADGQTFAAPWPATGKHKAAGRRDKVTYYQYKADPAQRTLRGIDEQIAKAEKAVAGKVSVKRNRFIKFTGGNKAVNRELEAKARALAGFKAYTPTSTTPARAGDRRLHQLWHIEKSFEMSKHDLRATGSA
ncbi:MAG TPA: hypothetical protein VFH56_05840 [Acidimicrobiales bacterium]|nr:hypothetical protein [Acidimicrobiales bacterium]